MTDDPVPSPDAPRELLASLSDLTRRVRAAQRGAWFPLLLLGALTLGAIPVARFAPYSITCRAIRNQTVQGRVCIHTSGWSLAYWALALVLGYAVTAVFYLRGARSRGVGTPVRPYILAGIGLAAATTAAALWVAHDPPALQQLIWDLRIPPVSWMALLITRLLGPTSVIGLALLVLSWVERSRALLVFTLGYLVIVLASVTFGWTITPPGPFGRLGSPWFFLPHLVIPGVLLLLGGLAFALSRLPRHRATS